MVSSYLIHHGYVQTAETFAKCTDLSFNEETTAIKNRQSKCNKLEILLIVHFST